ncbi:MAG: bifunctional 3-deoxy-7-phosphoheptulonate synthase/chorismate mutase type II [Cyclobacteriaceae bacterium]|nr:bifunctional 3-deoxy-7-phosphoheptulonate synthase/chorismate mutase type II [Cyclobacteriaceae bacterium]
MNIELNIEPMEKWFPKTKDLPLLIAGPCSAETEEQVLETAKLIEKDHRAMVYRAGLWKPRTRPGTFEGVGAEGLPWLKRVKEETRLLVATEVAKAEHVQQAIDAGVDILWIGARTTVNPFSVQEIADALKGHDIPVLVKNPINPDLQLWIGALERINQAGITKLGAIHRGFSPNSESKYRNDPKWKMAIELKRLLPEMPIVCDPSHIGGSRELIEPVAQKAFDLQMEGLMIETHINPDVALSDAKQQVTPARLKTILDAIILRRADSANNEFVESLKELRGKIDTVDNELINLLGKRMALVDEIGESKKENNVTILQVGRYESILNDRVAKGEDENLSPDFVKDIFEFIHQNSIKRQEKIMND